MTDIARLGFSANTGDLKKAKADLDALVPSARRAERATDKFNRAAAGVTTGVKGASAGIKSFDAAATGALGTTDRLSKAALATGTGMKTVQAAAVGASASMRDLVATTARVGVNFAQADAHVEAYKRSLMGVAPAAQSARSSLARLGSAANDNINRLQATPGNIAAQFQDIGVTAAAGMNPMLIALQQGTQLSSAMSGGLGNVIAGFRQLFSVSTVLTIGLVGAVAAGLQMVDWMKLAERAAVGLADGIEFLVDVVNQYSEVVIYAGIVAAVAFGPRILASVTALSVAIAQQLVTAISTATLAMISFTLANPFTALLYAVLAVIAVLITFNDTARGIFNQFVAMVKEAADATIGYMVGAYKLVVGSWENLPRVIGYLALKAVDLLINSFAAGINLLGSMWNQFADSVGIDLRVGPVSSNIAETLMGQTGADLREAGQVGGYSYVDGFISAASDAIGAGVGFLRGLSFGGVEEAAAGGRNSAAQAEVDRITQAYENLIAATQRRITALGVEATALGMSENAARLYRNEQDLIAQAIAQNIPLTDQVRSKLGELAEVLTGAEISKEIAEMTVAFKDQQQALREQSQLIGLSGLELAYNANYQDLVNEAVRRGVIDLSNMNDEMRQYVALLGERAMILARDETANNEAQFVADATAAYEANVFALQRERNELNLSGSALEAYRIETELLLSAKRQGLELSPQTIALLRSQSVAEAELTEQIRKQRDQVEFSRDTFKGFFQDMISGLRQGQSVWETFGNAVLRVVDKIVDRLLFSEGGGISGLLGALGGLLGGGGSLKASIKGSALGNVFGSTGQIDNFAKGGAFTNGIYSSPTLFKFAKGAAFGQMGEAGPEAVMPLKRGPDGSLGVQMHGPQMVNVQIGVNDDRFNAYVDDRSGAQVAANAPAIANAGSQIAQKNLAVQRSRTIGG